MAPSYLQPTCIPRTPLIVIIVYYNILYYIYIVCFCDAIHSPLHVDKTQKYILSHNPVQPIVYIKLKAFPKSSYNSHSY